MMLSRFFHLPIGHLNFFGEGSIQLFGHLFFPSTFAVVVVSGVDSLGYGAYLLNGSALGMVFTVVLEITLSYLSSAGN